MKILIYRNGKLADYFARGSNNRWGMEEELKRVILLVPKWKPAKIRGQAVNSFLLLKVGFYIDND